MKAGKQLNKLVAEKVFGWVEDRNLISYNGVCPFTMPDGLSAHLRFWSEDIKDAWEVVAFFASTPFLFKLEQENTHKKIWRATLIHSNPGQTKTATAETAAHAICLVAVQ